MAQELTIKTASLNDDGKNLGLTIVVHNPSTRTRYVYSSLRALRYDNASKTLDVQLSDHGLGELRDLRGAGAQATFLVPDMTMVGSKSDAELSLRLERTLRQIDPANSQATLKLVTHPIHEATTVKVDVAWGDEPFYADPRTPHAMRQQLVKWSQGVASYRISLSPRRGGGDDNDRGNRRK